MKRCNLYNGSSRVFESGAVWQEKITNNIGSIYVREFSACRIRATGNCVISIDGVTALSLTTGEIEVLNAGASFNGLGTVQITVTGANVFLQESKESGVII